LIILCETYLDKIKGGFIPKKPEKKPREITIETD